MAPWGIAQQQTIENPVFIGGVATANEETALRALLDSTYATLRSEAFKSNLMALSSEYPTIFLRLDGAGPASVVRNGSVKDLVDIVQAKSPNRYVKAPVSLVGGDMFAFALSGVTGDGVNASFTLGRNNFSNWSSADMVMRSCAVNTVAHELSHLISSHATAFRLDTQPIKDGGAASNSGTNAVASYLVGSVAQCTWLQQNGYSPAVDLKSCVKVFGHRGFNRARCTQFNQDREIKERDGLYSPHVIVDGPA